MSDDERRLMAGRAIVAKIVADDVKAAVAQYRGVLENGMDTDEGVAAVLPDGTRVGSVKRSKPRRSASVTDEAALLAWVKQHRPDELVQSVNPAYKARLIELAKTHGVAVDVETGEVIPGVEETEGSPSYLVQPDKAQVPLVRARLSELVSGVLAIESDREAS